MTEQNIVAVVGYCPFYRTTASTLLEMSFLTGVL